MKKVLRAMLAVIVFIPLAAFAQTDAVDLTATFVDGGLERARELTDCRFELNSVAGVISLRGQVTREIQSDFAIRLVGRIEGVKSVHSTVTLAAPGTRRRGLHE